LEIFIWYGAYWPRVQKTWEDYCARHMRFFNGRAAKPEGGAIR